MIEKVIVPLDGSITAEVALPYAEEFTARSGKELVLLFVKEPGDYRSENIIQNYLDNLASKAKDSAKQYLPKTESKTLKTETKILTGDPAEEILKYVESQPGSHVVMATHGKSGVGTRWTLGSVANKVARSTSRPITFIRSLRDQPAIRKKDTLKTIVAAVDGTKAGEASLPYVKDMAQMVNAPVTFLHIMTKELVTYKMIEVPISEERKKAAREYLENLVADFKKSGVNANYEIWETRGDIGGEIVEYTEKKPVDLIVLAAQGHSGLRYWGIGSVTNKVINEANSPVMVVKAAQK